MQTKIKIYHVDAFTKKLFKGNPAAVCITDTWLSDSLMQNIAAENNLAETAFVVPHSNQFQIRWFTPTIEVDLCGHATLASAFVILNFTNYKREEVIFNSSRSGILKVKKEGESLALNFPTDTIEKIAIPDKIIKGIGVTPVETYRGKTDYMAVLSSSHEVEKLVPDFGVIKKLNARGLIVTAKGSDTDFVSRFFAPQSGIDEDPVTGSAHTTLTPYWAGMLDKRELSAKQISKRGGYLKCNLLGERVEIIGQAVLYMVGEIDLK